MGVLDDKDVSQNGTKNVSGSVQADGDDAAAKSSSGKAKTITITEEQLAEITKEINDLKAQVNRPPDTSAIKNDKVEEFVDDTPKVKTGRMKVYQGQSDSEPLLFIDWHWHRTDASKPLIVDYYKFTLIDTKGKEHIKEFSLSEFALMQDYIEVEILERTTKIKRIVMGQRRVMEYDYGKYAQKETDVYVPDEIRVPVETVKVNAGKFGRLELPIKSLNA